MCTDEGFATSVPPALLHDVELKVTIELEPVDSVVVTTLIDNVTDIFMPDQGPARRFDRALPAVTAGLMTGQQAPDALLAEHGFSVLVDVTKGDTTHRFLFDTGTSPDGVVENMRRLQIDPRDDRGRRLQPRSFRPHHRARRPGPGARAGEHAGAHPPALLAATADDAARPGAARGADDQPARAGGGGL